eukprot:68880-Rhodomonas_salina.2
MATECPGTVVAPVGAMRYWYCVGWYHLVLTLRRLAVPGEMRRLGFPSSIRLFATCRTRYRPPPPLKSNAHFGIPSTNCSHAVFSHADFGGAGYLGATRGPPRC